MRSSLRRLRRLCKLREQRRAGWFLGDSGEGRKGDKVKNPKAPGVTREAEEDWGNRRWSRARRWRVVDGSDCGTMRDTIKFAAFLPLLILAVTLLARFIVS